MKIPYNKAHLTKKESNYIKDAHKRGQLAGDWFYAKKTKAILVDHYGAGVCEMDTILLLGKKYNKKKKSIKKPPSKINADYLLNYRYE